MPMRVYISGCCRPDLIDLASKAVKKTCKESCKVVAHLHGPALKRDWQAVDGIVYGGDGGYSAWRDILNRGERSLVMHDDCVPVSQWSFDDFGEHSCMRRDAGWSLIYSSGSGKNPAPLLEASRVCSTGDCPPAWSGFCELAASFCVESLLDGKFLHVDKGTIAHPESQANLGKDSLIAALANALGVEAPEPLSAEELAAHPGRKKWPRLLPPGLGDYVAAGLDALGITKDRVQAVASAVGIKDCGCKQRQQKLTEFGQKYLGIGVPKQP